MKNCKNVLRYVFGAGAIHDLPELLKTRRQGVCRRAIVFIDHFFRDRDEIPNHFFETQDNIFFVDTTHEPKTTDIDALAGHFRKIPLAEICAVIGIGGGATLDTAKAVANLLTNEGLAEIYQGWDLVKHPAIFKIAVPTLSGTGSETSRTCVMTNVKNGLKLGMNSDHTIFDQLIMDPNLSKTVPREQYFYTGLDTYIHCIESLAGSYRHPVGDAFSHQANALCRQVFLQGDMLSDENREKMMVASYLGGCAIANSFVGLVHPFSAGLGVVLGIHHGVGNCIALNALGEYYPREVEEFRRMMEKQRVDIPRGVCKGLSDKDFASLYESTIIHEKPLSNALGSDFKMILTPEKVRSIFALM